jgi:hypothetical protein
MTTDKRRAEIDKVRQKIWDQVTKLNDELDDEGHVADCPLRCYVRYCDNEHTCPICLEDGE